MGINLGSRDIFMSKHDLDSPQISACLQQVAGERMPYAVRRYLLFYTRQVTIFFDNFPKSLPGQRAASEIQEEIWQVGLFK